MGDEQRINIRTAECLEEPEAEQSALENLVKRARIHDPGESSKATIPSPESNCKCGHSEDSEDPPRPSATVEKQASGTDPEKILSIKPYPFKHLSHLERAKKRCELRGEVWENLSSAERRMRKSKESSKDRSYKKKLRAQAAEEARRARLEASEGELTVQKT